MDERSGDGTLASLRTSLMSQQGRDDEMGDYSDDSYHQRLLRPEERNENSLVTAPSTSFPAEGTHAPLIEQQEISGGKYRKGSAGNRTENWHMQNSAQMSNNRVGMASKDSRKRNGLLGIPKGRHHPGSSLGGSSKHSRYSAVESRNIGFELRKPYKIDPLDSFGVFFYPLLLLVCAAVLIIVGIAFLVPSEDRIGRLFCLTDCGVQRRTKDLIGGFVLITGILFPFVWIRFLSWLKSPRRIDSQNMFNSDALLDVKLSAQAAFEHYDVLGINNIATGTITMIAGASAPRRILLPIAVKLAAWFRVIIIDVPGQGSLHSVPFSLNRASRVVCHILDREIGFSEYMRRVLLVGWGASGYTAAYLCANDPHRIAGLAILGPVPNYVSPRPCSATGFEKSFRLRWICAWGNFFLKRRVMESFYNEAHKTAVELHREELMTAKRHFVPGLANETLDENQGDDEPNTPEQHTTSNGTVGEQRSLEGNLQPVKDNEGSKTRGDVYQLDDFNLNTVPTVIHSIRRRNLLSQLRSFRRPMLVAGPAKWVEEAQSLIPTSLLQTHTLESLDSPLIPPQNANDCSQIVTMLSEFSHNLELPAIMSEVEQREVRKASMSSFHSLTG